MIFCTSQSDETGKEKPGKLALYTRDLKLILGKDLFDLRTDRKLLSSLSAQTMNAQTWQELGGSGKISVMHTVREAVDLVREKYPGAKTLITGCTFLSSGAIHVLESTSLSRR